MSIVNVKVSLGDIECKVRQLVVKSKLLGDYSRLSDYCDISEDSLTFLANNCKYVYDKSFNFIRLVVRDIDGLGDRGIDYGSSLFNSGMEGLDFSDKYYVVFYTDAISQYVIVINRDDCSVVTGYSLPFIFTSSIEMWNGYIRINKSFGGISYLIGSNFKVYKLQKERVV